MPIFIGKPHHFILDRGAIPWSVAANLAGVHRGAGKICPNQVMDANVGVRDVARQLVIGYSIRKKRKRLRIVIARLKFRGRIINSAPIESRWRAGLESRCHEAEAMQCLADAGARPLPCPTPIRFFLSKMHQRPQKRTGRQADGSRLVDGTTCCADSANRLFAGPLFDE